MFMDPFENVPFCVVVRDGGVVSYVQCGGGLDVLVDFFRKVGWLTIPVDVDGVVGLAQQNLYGCVNRKIVAPKDIKTDNCCEGVWTRNSVVSPGGWEGTAGCLASGLVGGCLPDVGFVSKVSPPKLDEFLDGWQIGDLGVFIAYDESREGRKVFELVDGTFD